MSTGPRRSRDTSSTSSVSSTRGRWAMRDRPGLAWLVLAVGVALAHSFVPESTWLMVHLVLLGALTHSALVWSTHFAQALLKSRSDLDPRRHQTERLVLLLVGTSLVLVGFPSGMEPLTVVGATAVSGAVLWHAYRLWRRLREALPGRFRTTVHYYLGAAACLVVGATLGATLARTEAEPWHGRLLVAHSMVMTLGWMGLTVHGTLLTLWPTMLRTRIDERAEDHARQALPLFGGTLAVILAGCLTGSRGITVAGLLAYLGTLVRWALVLVRTARRRRPHDIATVSVALALGWLVVAVVEVIVIVARTEGWQGADDAYGIVAATVAVGFAAQLLTGALSYLVPSVLGGGPSVVRAGQAWFGRFGAARLAVVNGGLLLGLLPVPPTVRLACVVLVLVALAAFVPLTFAAIRACAAARRALLANVAAKGPADAGGAPGTLHVLP